VAGEKAASLLRALAGGEPLASAAARLGMTAPEAKALLEKLAARVERAAAEKAGVGAPAPVVTASAPGTWRLFTDGAARGNPGPAGAGAVLVSPDGQHEQLGKFLGVQTNNVAEYEGLILGLLLVQDLALAPGRLVAVRGDSMLVVNQLTGAWAVKDANMEKLHAEACRLLLATGVSSRAIEHVYREANAEADHYANIAMDTQGGQSYREAAFFPGHRAKEADTPAAAAVAAASSSSSSSSSAAAAAAPTPPTSVAAAAAAAVAATVAGMADAAPAVGRKRERASGDHGDDAAGPAAQRRRS